MDLVDIHTNFSLLNVNNLMLLMCRLAPFFFNLIRKRGFIFLIGVNHALLKSFKYNKQYGQQEVILY